MDVTENNKAYTFEGVNGQFGVEIGELDLGQSLNAETAAILVDGISKYGFVLVRQQSLTDQDQEKITDLMGNIVDQNIHTWAPEMDTTSDPLKKGNPNSKPVINTGNSLFFVNGPGLSEGAEDKHAIWDQENAHNDGVGTSCWHTADSEKMNFEVVNMLYAVKAPEKGGHTLFSDTTAVYKSFSPKWQTKFDSLRVLHRYRPESVPKENLQVHPVSQSLVKQHASSGEKYLHLNYNTIDRIEGMSREESYQIIKMIYERQIEDRFIYMHEWKDGDFLAWNCNGTMHKRGSLVSGIKRILRRTQTHVPALQSTREWDMTQEIAECDNEYWHPYPFKD